MTDLATLVARLQADNSQYIKALDQSTARLDKFSKEQKGLLDGFGEKLNELGGEIAGAFAVDKILEFSVSAIEAQSSLAKFSQEAGVSVDELSSLQVAFAASGVGTDELQNGFKKLNQAVSEAAGDSTSKAALAFKALGISVTDSNGNLKDAAAINAEVADAYSKTADGANKVAIQTALYGRGSLALIPALDEGAAALKAQQQAAIDAGAALSGPAAEAAKQLEDELAGLATTSKAQLQNALSAQLIPALIAVTSAFGDAKDRGAAFGVIATEIVSGLKVVATVGLEVARTFENVGEGLGSLAAQAVALAHGNLSQVSSIIQANSEDQDARNKKFADAEAALFNDSADKEIAAAQRAAIEKQEIQEGGVKSQLASLALLEKASAGVKSLTSYASGLKEQASAFDLGAEAATRQKLATGELGDALKVAAQASAAAAAASGPSKQALLDVADAAHKAAGEALAYAHALQVKKDTKSADDVIASLIKQTDTLDQSDAAAFRYKISTGELGAALDRLAKSGQDLRPALLAAENVFLGEKDKKAVDEINDSLLVLNGQLVQAAKNQFDLQNKGLRANIAAVGGPDATADLAAVDAKEKLTLAQARFNELALERNKIEGDFALLEAQINAALATGSTTTLGAEQQIATARAAEIVQLQNIQTQQQTIADQNAQSLPALTLQVNASKAQLVSLAANVDTISKQIRTDLEGAFANSLLEAETGAKSLKAAFTDMAKSIEKDLLTIANKNIAESLFGSSGSLGGASSFLGGLFGGGAGGTAIASTGEAATGTSTDSLIASFAGGFASGGTIPSGTLGVVGENGPELAYSGAKDMQIIPSGAGSGGKQSITNHFTIMSQNGTIARQSQMQVAAAAARSLSAASRRNN